MKLQKSGPKFKQGKYDFILDQRGKGQSISEIAKSLGMTKQGVSYYLVRYGDYKEKT